MSKKKKEKTYTFYDTDNPTRSVKVKTIEQLLDFLADGFDKQAWGEVTITRQRYVKAYRDGSDMITWHIRFR